MRIRIALMAGLMALMAGCKTECPHCKPDPEVVGYAVGEFMGDDFLKIHYKDHSYLSYRGGLVHDEGCILCKRPKVAAAGNSNGVIQGGWRNIIQGEEITNAPARWFTLEGWRSTNELSSRYHGSSNNPVHVRWIE